MLSELMTGVLLYLFDVSVYVNHPYKMVRMLLGKNGFID